MLEMLLFSSSFSTKMTIQKLTSFGVLHTDMTAVTIQSNKTVLNEVKDN